jgi:aspartyl-tRNA(Asn)/glutamyl-tRNA(Gln) amidotransferase subunit B
VRAHLEEDAGKSVHDAFHAATAIDLNRAGTPLLEVVTAPALHTAADAAAYMRALHELVVWLGICDGNLQEGSFRCDANVSVRRGPDAPLGTRAEIKNVNSFRFVEKAIEYEIERQIRELEAGRPIVQETRLYDETRNQTRSMRSKESAHDYRYFPDPDLPPLVVADALVDAERAALPELPAARRARYVAALGLSDYDAGALTASRALADYYEAVLAQLPDAAKPAANWVLGELAAALNAAGCDIGAARVAPAALAGLIRRTRDGTLSTKLAKDVFAAMWAEGSDADTIIAARGLGQISDDGPLVAAIDEVLAANPKQVGQYRAGDEKVFTWLVGQVMRATRGKANPARLNELLRERLAG